MSMTKREHEDYFNEFEVREDGWAAYEEARRAYEEASREVRLLRKRYLEAPAGEVKDRLADLLETCIDRTSLTGMIASDRFLAQLKKEREQRHG